jgi:hypothetical protein
MPTGTTDKLKRAECDFVSKTTADGELARPDMFTSRSMLFAAEMALTAIVKASEDATGTAARLKRSGATDYADFEPGVGDVLTPMINCEFAKLPIDGDAHWGPTGLMSMGATYCESLVGMRGVLDALRVERQVFYLSVVQSGVSAETAIANKVKLMQLRTRLEPNQTFDDDDIASEVARTDARNYNTAVVAQATKIAATKTAAATLAPRREPPKDTGGRGKVIRTTQPAAGAPARPKAGAPAPANRS